MAVKRKQDARKRRRYARSATRRGFVLRPPKHPGRIVATVAGVLAVITVALVWGGALKAKSDAYRAAKEAGEWTLDENAAVPVPVSVPAVRATLITPGDSVGYLDEAYDGVILSLGSGQGELPYVTRVAEVAGLTQSDGAGELEDEVTRLHRAGLNVTGVFQVTSLGEADRSVAAYRRGLEMAILSEYAESGIDDILLLGIPMGTDASDAAARVYLDELRSLTGRVLDPPAVGVAIPPEAFESGSAAETDATDTPLYAGSLTPGRLLSACDYLALDLRDAGDQADGVLDGMQYAYVRYSLRLLTDGTGAEAALAHGFLRVLEME